MKQALVGASIFDGDRLVEGRALIIENGRISAIASPGDLTESTPTILLDGGIVAPGFIDLQVNGGGGALFNNAPSVETLATMLRGHRATGTTAMLPTLLSDSPERHRAGVQAVADAIKAGMAGVLGIHIEGPFFSQERRGAHKAEWVRPPSAQDIDWLTSLTGFKVMLTLAPEQVPLGQIRALTEAGICVCAGHTSATCEQVENAIAAGLRGFTHLYNAMTPLLGREPGVVGAALADADTWCGIIVDGYHVHRTAIRAAYAAKPQGKLYLVTDAMATVGAEEKSFELYGETIREQRGHLINAEGRLAGSAIGMIDAVRISVREVGIALEESLKMASRYPAEFMQLDSELGWLKPGYRADIVHFDDEFTIKNTWVAGERLSHG